MNNIFTQLAIILSLSSFLGFIVYKLKLPLLIAYVLAGLLLSVLIGFDVSKSPLSFLPDIGIAFVLFLVGMELDLREIKNYGRQILIAGTLQIIITSVLGTFIAQSFGFGVTEAIYLGIGLSFSSTLVVVKLLLDKKELTSLYGKLALGVLLLEDLLAVVIILAMNFKFSLSLVNALPLSIFFIKIITASVLAYLLNRFLLNPLFKIVSDSPELLLLTSLAWCFSFITLSSLLDFSILIGAFLAGVVLASSPYHFHIQGRIKPMRDFFLSLFFVYLGTKVDFTLIRNVYPLIIAFAIYAVLGKPIIFMLLFGIFGFKKHTMFLTAVHLSQVSEFSLIVLLLALKSGLVSEEGLTVIALSSVLSFIISSLMISRSNSIYKHVSAVVSFFERKKQSIGFPEKEDLLSNHVVMIGAHRVGGDLVKFFKREKQPVVVLDHNPQQVERLLSQGISVFYGDMSDPEVLDILHLQDAKLIISTAPDLEGNKTLLEELKVRHINIPVITRAETIKEAQKLYKAGADYVIIPDLLAGDFLLNLLRDHINDHSYFKDRPKIELSRLSRKILAWE